MPLWGELEEVKIPDIDEFSQLFSRQVVDRKNTKKKVLKPTKAQVNRLIRNHDSKHRRYSTILIYNVDIISLLFILYGSNIAYYVCHHHSNSLNVYRDNNIFVFINCSAFLIHSVLFTPIFPIFPPRPTLVFFLFVPYHSRVFSSNNSTLSVLHLSLIHI